MRDARGGNEEGLVLVMMSVMLVALLAMAGVALDLGRWYLVAQREQRAADAAALAGAVYLPREPARAADTAAKVLKQNGMGTSRIEVHAVPENNRQLYVSVEQTVEATFSYFGLTSVNIKRSAVGEYAPPVAMGSPSNALGNQPPGDTWQNEDYSEYQGNYWLTIFGGQTSKIDGARWTAGGCYGETTPDNCDTTLPAPESNTEYSAGGQKYVLHVPRGTWGQVAVEIYDASYVNTGLHCTSDNLVTAEALDPEIYAMGDSPWCAGDTASSGGSTDTTYTLYYPDNWPTTPGRQVADCRRTFTPFVGDIGEEILNNPGGDTAQAFHKWSRLCTFTIYPSYRDADYTLKVATDRDGYGENQFSLRAGILVAGSLDVAQTNKLRLASESRLEIVTTSSTQEVTFFLAEINGAMAGRKLRTELYSLGDDSPTDVRIVPPLAATVNGLPMTEFTDCVRVKPTERSSVPASGCVYPKASASDASGEPGFTGRVGSITAPIPEGFDCDRSVPAGCWVRIELSYDHQATIQDTTSWATSTSGSVVGLRR